MVQQSSKDVHKANKRKGFYDTLDFLVLLHLNSMMGVTRRELAEDLGMQASTMSGCINRLIARGYVTQHKQRDVCQVTGNRVNVVSISNAGIAKIKEAP